MCTLHFYSCTFMLKVMELCKHILSPFLFKRPICFWSTIHQPSLICNLFLIYKLKHSQMGSCLIHLNIRCIIIYFFHFFNYTQLEILNIELVHWQTCKKQIGCLKRNRGSMICLRTNAICIL